MYGDGLDHGVSLSFVNGELRETLSGLRAACREAVSDAAELATIEIIPFEATIVLNVKSQFKPEAVVRIRITHPRGLEQPAGEGEEKALAGVIDRLNSLGVKRS